MPIASNMHAARRWLLAMAALLTAGCATITVQSGEGGTIVRRELGGLWITLEPPGRSVTSVRSVGVVSSPLGVSVGLASTQMTSLPAECRLIVWVRDEKEIQQLVRALEPAMKEGLCVERNL
jgi:hypothetical protein